MTPAHPNRNHEPADQDPGARRTTFDTVVVGAGLGGLAAAALLAHEGCDVAVLEAHSAVGGCAGCYHRYDRDAAGLLRRYRFDAGATTLSGLAPHQPMGRLFARLGLAPTVTPARPGMICHLGDGQRLVRYAGNEQWIAECERVFGARGQREFWTYIAAVDTQAWGLARRNGRFPPKSIRDVIALAQPGNLLHLPLARLLRRSMLDIADRFGLAADRRFVAFLDEQLMITAQSRAADAPALIGAMGLAYPGQAFYPHGGMYAVADLLAGVVAERGGELRLKRRVQRIERAGSGWRIHTARGETYHAGRIIANITLHNMTELMPDGRRHFSAAAESAGEGFGALTLNAAVRDRFADHGALYHQIHASIPYAESGSVFVSLSKPDDTERAPEGWRTLSVSTHVANSAGWQHLSRDEYGDRKRQVGESMIAAVAAALPGFAEAERKFQMVGTPQTFEHYTSRAYGMVGGIPHSVRRGLLGMQNHRTPFAGLHLVGDTVYPGQGAPAVVLGVLNLVEELLA